MRVYPGRWPEPIPAAQGWRWGPTVDRTPFHHRVHHTYHTQTGGSGDMPVHEKCASWGVRQNQCTGKTSHRDGENMPTQQTMTLSGNWFFCSHPCCHETMFNEVISVPAAPRLMKEEVLWMLNKYIHRGYEWYWCRIFLCVCVLWDRGLVEPKNRSTGQRGNIEQDSLLKKRIRAPKWEGVPETGMPTAKAKSFVFALFISCI